MDDITMEKKLRLVQQVRSQYHQNQSDLFNREQILYGKTSSRSFPSYEENTADYGRPESTVPAGSLGLRTVLAGALLAAVILFDRFGIRPAGMDMNHVFGMISEDYQENVTAFVDALTSETLSDSPVQ